MVYIHSLCLVATGSFDKTVKFFDYEHGRPRGRTLHHGEPVKTLSAANDKILSCGPCTVILWDLQSFSLLCKLPSTNTTFVGATLVAFTDLEKGAQYRCLTGDQKGTFKVWLPSSSTSTIDKPLLLQTFTGMNNLGNVMCYCVSPPPPKMMSTIGRGCIWPKTVICGSGREVELFVPRRIQKPHLPLVFSLHNRQSQTIITTENKNIKVFDLNTGSQIMAVIDASANEITAIGTDHSLQRKLYVGTSGGQLLVLNMTTGARMSCCDVHSGAVTAIMYCEHSRHVITTSLDRSIAVHKEKDANMEQLRVISEAHESPISAASYSAQLSMVASVGGEEIKIWNFQDLQLQCKLELHETEVTAITFVRNYPILVSSDIQGRVLIWKVFMGTAVENARAICLLSCVNDDHGILPSDIFVPGTEGECGDEDTDYEEDVTSVADVAEVDNSDREGKTKSGQNDFPGAHQDKITDLRSRIRPDPERSLRNRAESFYEFDSSQSAKASASVPRRSSTMTSMEGIEFRNLGNVRQLALVFDSDDDESNPDSSPKRILAADFSGNVSFFEFNAILHALDAQKHSTPTLSPTEYAFADENYNPNLRYQKNGLFFAHKQNHLLFPTYSVLSSHSFAAHEESILSLTPIVNSKMFVTTASDCKLIVWSVENQKVGLNYYPAGSMFGEIDTMDYEEKRIDKLEAWNVPDTTNMETKSEHDQIAMDALEYVRNVPDHEARSPANLDMNPAMGKEEALRIQLRNAGVHSSFLLGSETKSNDNPLLHGRRGSSVRKGLGIATKGRGHATGNTVSKFEVVTSDEKRSILFRLDEVNQTKQSKVKRKLQTKRASIIFQATALEDANEKEYELDDFLQDRLELEKLERAKNFEIRKVLETMRMHLQSAHSSKTRSGKVVYNHLYGELKDVASKSGHNFTPVDTSMSTFLSEKFASNNIVVKKKKSKKKKRNVLSIGRPTLEIDHDDATPKAENFFVTQRPETPQQRFTLEVGPHYESSDDEISLDDKSLESTFTRQDETVESAMSRVQDRADYVEDLVKREDSLMVFDVAKKTKAKAERERKHLSRKSLITRFKAGEEHRKKKGKVNKISEKQKENIKRHSRRSIANSSHFGTYSREDVLQLADLLYSMDQNGDGNVEPAEFEYYIKHGKHGEVFSDLNFDLMDMDHSGFITVQEIVDLCFGNASAMDKQRIIICIDEEKQRRTQYNMKRRAKPKGRRITIGDMQNAAQIFQFYDMDHSGMVDIDEICKGIKEVSERCVIDVEKPDKANMSSPIGGGGCFFFLFCYLLGIFIVSVSQSGIGRSRPSAPSPNELLVTFCGRRRKNRLRQMSSSATTLKKCSWNSRSSTKNPRIWRLVSLPG